MIATPERHSKRSQRRRNSICNLYCPPRSMLPRITIITPDIRIASLPHGVGKAFSLGDAPKTPLVTSEYPQNKTFRWKNKRQIRRRQKSAEEKKYPDLGFPQIYKPRPSPSVRSPLHTLGQTEQSTCHSSRWSRTALLPARSTTGGFLSWLPSRRRPHV